jgi:hypothetical protein
VTYFSVVLYFGEKAEDIGAVGREGIAGGPFSFPIVKSERRGLSPPCRPPG